MACATCSEIFKQQRYGQKYCSRPCRNRRPRNLSEAAQERRQERERQRVRPAQTCSVCGEQYNPTGGKQKTCSRKCAGALSKTEDRAWHKRWPASKLDYRQCRVCNRLFIGRGSRRSCSDVCAAEMKRRQGLEYNATRPRRNPPPAPCMVCGQGSFPFPPRRCDACRRLRKRQDKRRRKAAKLQVQHEPYTLAEIAARDRYVCQLCRPKRRVAMTKAVPHPKAPVIDHRVPLAEGGDDIKANVQLAHFLCNSIKSNHGDAEQLRCIG